MAVTTNPWPEVRERLLLLGWTPDDSHWKDALRSPKNAMLVGAEEVNDAERRESLVRSLRMQMSTLQHHITTKTVDPIDRMQDALSDFRQLVDCLIDLGLAE